MNTLSTSQLKFVELVIQGHTATAAYATAYPRCSEAATRTQGSRLLRKPKVAAVIAELRAELAEKVKAETIATLKEVLEFLTAVIRTPVGWVDENHPLSQYLRQTQTSRVVKLPCKLRAAELAMKLQGFLSDKVQHEAGDTLQDFLLEIRAGGSGGA